MLDPHIPLPSEPSDPVSPHLDSRWYRVASRDEALSVIDRALRSGRRRRLVAAERHIAIVTDHMLACGFLFLRRVRETGGLMTAVTVAPLEPSDCPDLVDYRRPAARHFTDVAAYAIEIIGREDREVAWSAAFHLGGELPGYGNEVLWRAGARPSAPWRISEVRIAEDAARAAERQRYPSWDDWC